MIGNGWSNQPAFMNGALTAPRWVPPRESPWKEGGYPLFAMAFPLAVTTAAAFGRSEPDGFVVPRPLIYSRN